MPFAVILFSTIFGAVCVFTLLFRCLGAVSVYRLTAKQRLEKIKFDRGD